ncbi:MAG: 5'-methylthioadenosine/adenosylhomocysteine nucleosidase [Chloroflexota bacterium]
MTDLTPTSGTTVTSLKGIRRIGLIGALDVEVADLIAMLAGVREEQHAGLTFHVGDYGGLECVVVKANVGKVAAACCTQLLISELGVQAIVFSGIAGAARADLKPGDIVISTDTVQHDIDSTAFGLRPGEFDPPSSYSVAADIELRRLALAAARSAEFERIKPRIFEGRILTGDQFIVDRARVEKLGSDFDGLAVEMEGGAVAQVCAWNRVPFVILRSISDSGDGNFDVYWDFRSVSAHNSARVVRGLLDLLIAGDA